MASGPAQTGSFADFQLVDRVEVASLHDLVGYWERKRGNREMPSRADIDPVELVSHLPHLMLFDVIDDGDDFGLRLIGTAITTGLGRDSTGKTMRQIVPEHPFVLDLFRAIVNGRKPRFGIGSVFWVPDREFHRFSAVYLPLSADGTRVDMILSEFVVD